MSSEMADFHIRYQQLEKENRILRKKLERSEANCVQLEETTQKKESLLRQVIRELQDSQTTLEEQRGKFRRAITKLKQTQAQLIQTEKMSSLGQLVAGVAHEINNPVNFIHGNLTHVEEYARDLLGFVKLYQQHYPEPVPEIQAEAEDIDIEFLQTDLPKVLASMQMGTARIRQIVLSLRNFSRTDESECKEVDLHEGIESTLLILQHSFKDRSGHRAIEIRRDYGDLPSIECYPSQLNQVFMNILVNAIDAIEEANLKRTDWEIEKNPGKVTIRTSTLDDDWVEISISDTGVGIPESIQKHIFDPFFTTKAIGKGTGMGMSIAYQIITEKHGGKFACFSKLGKGTDFIIQIPVRQDVRVLLS